MPFSQKFSEPIVLVNNYANEHKLAKIFISSDPQLIGRPITTQIEQKINVLDTSNVMHTRLSITNAKIIQY